MFQDTCILLFSRSANEEARFKRLHHINGRNQIVHKKLHQHCSKIIIKSKLDLIVFDEKKQQGENFAEKITHAISSAFEMYDKVIIVGSDCPELNVSDIHTAAEGLANNLQVIGLEKKGGSYLIGLQKSLWNPKLFRELEWNTNQLGNQLSALLLQESKLIFLDEKADINKLSDIFILPLLAEIKRFIASLLSILQHVNIDYIFNKKLDFNFIQNPISFRGPPRFQA